MTIEFTITGLQDELSQTLALGQALMGRWIKKKAALFASDGKKKKRKKKSIRPLASKQASYPTSKLAPTQKQFKIKLFFFCFLNIWVISAPQNQGSIYIR